MLTRRNVVRWALGVTGSLLSGMNVLSRASYAQEPDQPPHEMSMEDWMTEWMSGTKAVRGMLNVSRFREPIYFLTAPISWTPNSGQERYEAVNVPTGFVTDFASIPPVFWSVLRPDGEYAYAAVVHDYLYWSQTRARDEADQIFKMAMEDFRIEALKVKAIYGAVRAGGQSAWNSNAKKKAQGEQRILSRFPRDPRTSWSDWQRRPDAFAP